MPQPQRNPRSDLKSLTTVFATLQKMGFERLIAYGTGLADLRDGRNVQMMAVNVLAPAGVLARLDQSPATGLGFDMKPNNTLIIRAENEAGRERLPYPVQVNLMAAEPTLENTLSAIPVPALRLAMDETGKLTDRSAHFAAVIPSAHEVTGPARKYGLHI